MKYKIQYNYNTGDSFSHTDGLEDSLEVTWENLDIAKENIKRIEEHYKAFQKVNGWSMRRGSNWDNYKHERWYHSEYSIKLLTDKNEEYIEYTGSWCGYFESLNYVGIIPDNDDSDMKIVI